MRLYESNERMRVHISVYIHTVLVVNLQKRLCIWSLDLAVSSLSLHQGPFVDASPGVYYVILDIFVVVCV